MNLHQSDNSKVKAVTRRQLVIEYSWDGCPLVESDQATVDLSWLENGDLSIEINAPFAGDPKPISDQQSCWELWNYEVVELFLVGDGLPAPYTEIEISPWGNHLVMQLLGTRNIIAQQLPLVITALSKGERRWQASAVIAKALLPTGNLMANAYRISGTEPNRSYHVMTPLGGEEPDFHRIDQFTLQLARPN